MERVVAPRVFRLWVDEAPPRALEARCRPASGLAMALIRAKSPLYSRTILQFAAVPGVGGVHAYARDKRANGANGRENGERSRL